MNKGAKSRRIEYSDFSFANIDRRMSWTFGAIIFVIMLILFGAVTLFNLRLLDREENNLSHLVASILGESVRRVSFSGKYHSRLLLEDLVKENSKIDYIAIIGLDGHVFAHSDPALNDTEYPEEEIRQILAKLRANPSFVRTVWRNGQETKEINLIYRGGYRDEILGILQVGIPVQSRTRAIRAGILYSGVLIFLLLVIALLVIHAVSDRIGHPVKRMASLLKEVGDATPDLIYYKGLDLRFMGCNRAFADFAGMRRKEIPGLKDEDLFDPSQAMEFSRMDERALSSGETVFHEAWVHYPDSRAVYLQTQHSPLRTREGIIFGVVAYSRNLTAQKMMEEDLHKLNRDLEKRVMEELAKRREQERLLILQSRLAAMGEMIGNIAHQWRQPLNALGMIIQDIEDAWAYGEVNQEYIQNMIESSNQIIQKMSSTIDDFRNFFKRDREKSSFSLKKSVEETCSIMQPGMIGKGIHVDVEGDDSVCVTGYPNEFSQVILNVLANARDAIVGRERAEKWIRIQISPEREGHGRVEIYDSGGGIPEEIVDKIFDPYFTTKDKSGGTGIGLYMSRMIIETNMGGSIRVRNTEKGTCFIIII